MIPALTDTQLSPLEFVVIAFEGDQFAGDILPALGALIESGTVRVIDMAFVSKHAGGSVSVLEMSELSAELAGALIALTGEVSGLSEDDLLGVADGIDPGMTAATILVEHLWLDRFAKAVRGANGVLVMSERIPHEVAVAARAAVIEAASLTA